MPLTTDTTRARFFGPHPGFLGALARIPGGVRMVAVGLNGQTVLLRNALAMLAAAVPNRQEFTLDVIPKSDDWPAKVMLTYVPTGGGYPQHAWRVIQFEVVE